MDKTQAIHGNIRPPSPPLLPSLALGSDPATIGPHRFQLISMLLDEQEESVMKRRVWKNKNSGTVGHHANPYNKPRGILKRRFVTLSHGVAVVETAVNAVWSLWWAADTQWPYPIPYIMARLRGLFQK
ncbi:uncharacterized protein BO87DRAFT_25925 [Aspergillus neoniger CBS 115656]|uniref:Uncharacterized protein n=1 Tax=Aspergillus neoniger (strain CBS 115656) TaxID=1448310 RepID=A0A318Z6P7_ASPNB|nr:hypothetical protein BO87DRAFT_25925 [Aspergillus neoniger CBS 115656]PYH35878.1 hypothetical protein BO87DRAFT_25925 [Aspergillus neoniger CBS 115656]